MRKYFLLAAISAALFLTACGNNQSNTVETSAVIVLQTSATTLNSATEMTVPAFEPELEGTEVTTPAYIYEKALQIMTYVELAENEHVAYITDVFENKNGGYSLVVEAYEVAGYYSPVRISLYSENEFEAGDWVKVEFAPETCFMETSPLQVARQDIVKIELIDY